MRKVLVGKISKAIYGTLLGAIIFFNKQNLVIVNMEFKMNEYDECNFNKMINRYPCTIQMHGWHLSFLF